MSFKDQLLIGISILDERMQETKEKVSELREAAGQLQRQAEALDYMADEWLEKIKPLNEEKKKYLKELELYKDK